MFHSIKTKFIITLSFLIVFLLGVTAILLVTEKQRELAHDIDLRMRAFAEFTAPVVVDAYATYLVPGSFVYFQRELMNIFEQNEDLASIRLYSFDGTFLYDSETEVDIAYAGPERKVNDSALLSRIQFSKPSLTLEDGQIFFLRKNPDGTTTFVDVNDEPIPAPEPGTRMQELIYPVRGEFAVQYNVTYEHLLARVRATTERIILLIVFGILVGLLAGYHFSVRITKPILELTSVVSVIAKGKFQERATVRTRDEIGRLATSVNKMAHDLEESTKARIYQERVKKELEVAARLQREILPTTIPKLPHLDLAVGFMPAAEIGGDCYDFIETKKDGSTYMYLGDATGHGVPSGLVVALSSAILSSFSHLDDPCDVLVQSNRILKGKISPNMFMTLVLLSWNSTTQKLRFANAGHERLLYGSVSDEKVVEVTGASGIALGMLPDISKMIKTEDLPLKRDDFVVAYSDGIPEARNAKNEQYGFGRFKRVLSDSLKLSTAEAIKNAIFADVQEFMGATKQVDDITALVLRRT